ncbi:hypothetical protein CsSME_00053404 [Camellia sinensis var. sinensis]
MRNTIVTMQHAHAFAYKADLMKKDLIKKEQEATDTLQQLNEAEATRMRLLDKFNAARRGEQWTEATTKAAKKRATKVENDLAKALATKDTEIKATDEKAYAEACNRGYCLRWAMALEKLSDSKDSPLRDFGQLKVSFPPSPPPTLNDQVMDLTEENEVEVSKSTSSKKANTSEAEIAVVGKSLDETLKEIVVDAEAKNGIALPTKANTLLNAEVEQIEDIDP